MEKIKLKLGVINTILRSEKILNLINASTKTMKAKMDIVKNIKTLTLIDTETKEAVNNLVKEYGVPNEQGVLSLEENHPKLLELANIEEEVEIRKIKVDEFTNANDLDGKDLMYLIDIMIVD